MNYIKVKDVTEFVRNGASIKQDKQCLNGIPITRIETISNSQFNWDKFGYANITDDKYKDYYLKDKDVLLSHINSVKFLGRSVIFNRKDSNPIIHGMNLLCLRFNQNKYIPDFFVWYSKSQIAKQYIIENTKKAVNQASITSSAIKEMPIPNITLAEQKEIITQLERIQYAIYNKKQQLSLLDEAVKSEFVEMFGEIKETVIIKDVCDVSGGYSFKSNDISDNEGVKILQIGNVAINDISWETTNYLPKSFIEKYNNFSLNENDIVMALTRPIIQSLGNVKTCMIRACDLPCLLNQRVGRIRPKDNTNIHYIFYCFMQHSFTSYIQACCKGSSQPNMSTKDIENFIIPKATIELQNQFAAFVQQIDKSKFVVKQQIADLQELLDSKMQEYFGE